MHVTDVLAKYHGCENELRSKLLRIYDAIVQNVSRGHIDVTINTKDIDPDNKYFIKLMIMKLEDNGYNVSCDYKTNILRITWLNRKEKSNE